MIKILPVTTFDWAVLCILAHLVSSCDHRVSVIGFVHRRACFVTTGAIDLKLSAYEPQGDKTYTKLGSDLILRLATTGQNVNA